MQHPGAVGRRAWNSGVPGSFTAAQHTRSVHGLIGQHIGIPRRGWGAAELSIYRSNTLRG